MKPLSPYCVQWEALFLLVAGITINQLRNCPSTGVVEAAVPIVTAGLCVLGSVTVPSAASVRKEEGGGEGVVVGGVFEAPAAWVYGPGACCGKAMFILSHTLRSVVGIQRVCLEEEHGHERAPAELLPVLLR